MGSSVTSGRGSASDASAAVGRGISSGTGVSVGAAVGFMGRKLPISEGVFGKKEIVSFAVINVIANVVAWLVIAPVLDIAIYAEPAAKVFAQGAMAAVANSITAAVIGALLCAAYSKTIAGKGSLDAE